MLRAYSQATRSDGPLRVGVTAAVCILSACDFGTFEFVDVPQPGETTITVVLTADNDQASGVLGWDDGRVPGATIRLTGEDDATPWTVEGISDANGTVTFEDVPVGSHVVEVSRLLESHERDLLVEQGVWAFIARTTLSVTPSSDDVSLAVYASRSRSLVISEVRAQADLTAAGLCCYNFGKFIELYNNTDSTIYLDGKVIGLGFSLLYDLSPNRPCSMFDHLRVDPQGIWAVVFEQFPGTGSDYPLAPGTAAVVATDAIDHSAFAPSALDLTGAAFESFGNADVDNPAVPNMIDIGLAGDALGHGLRASDGAVFVAEAVSTADLARDREPDSGREWARIPADRLLDVVVSIDDSDPTFSPCQTVSHPAIDRAWTRSVSERDPELSLQRRALLTLSDGRVVLQHTGSSNADIVSAPVTVGVLGVGTGN